MSVEIFVTFADLDWIITVEEYHHTPEELPKGPSYSCGGEPGWPAEVEVVTATVSTEVDIDELGPTEADVDNLYDMYAHNQAFLERVLADSEVQDAVNVALLEHAEGMEVAYEFS